MKKLLLPTPMLDYTHPDLQALLLERGWAALPQRERIGAVYDYVQNTLLFGYNTSDSIPASAVLRDGYGQCNTKATLCMALLRALGIPCRLHGFFVKKELQKGALTGLSYRLSPRDILHSWVEVYWNDAWIALEGLILDDAYLRSIQERFSSQSKNFCGYGVAVDFLQSPEIKWTGRSTYIQKNAITADLGVFDSPDAFLAAHSQKLSPIKRFLFSHIVRHRMNRSVRRLRAGV